MAARGGNEDRYGRTSGDFDDFISPRTGYGEGPDMKSDPQPVFRRVEDDGAQPVFKRAAEGAPEPVFKRVGDDEAQPVFKRSTDDATAQPVFKRVPESEEGGRPVFKRAPPDAATGYPPPMYPPQYPMYNPYMNVAMYRVRKPQGTPSKSFFYMGGLGSLVLLAACVMLGIVSINEMIFFEIESAGMMLAFIIGLLCVECALILMSVGFFGYYYNYGSQLGAATSILFIFTSVLVAIFIFFNFEELQTIEENSEWYYPGSDLIGLLSIGTFIFIGACFIMGSVTMSWWRYPSGNVSLCVGAVVFGSLAGCFIISIFMQVFGIAFWVGIVASILFFLVFAKNKLPQFDEESQSYKTDSQLPQVPQIPMPYPSPMMYQMPYPYMMQPGQMGNMPQTMSYGQGGAVSPYMPHGRPGDVPLQPYGGPRR